MDLSELDDDALLALAQKALEGDLRPFDVLVERNQGWVRANCRQLTRSGEEEDLAQEVFIKAYFGLQRFEGRSSFKTWIARIKGNHCMNHIRKMGARPRADRDLDQISEQQVAVDPRAPKRIHADDERRRIDKILEGMSETLRVPLILRDMDEMSYQEIANVLGAGLSAVKMRIKRARSEFRERLRDAATEPECEDS